MEYQPARAELNPAGMSESAAAEPGAPRESGTSPAPVPATGTSPAPVPALAGVLQEPMATGDPRVDGAVRGLGSLAGLDVAEHAEVFERIHASLVEILGGLRTDADTSGYGR